MFIGIGGGGLIGSSSIPTIVTLKKATSVTTPGQISIASQTVFGLNPAVSVTTPGQISITDTALHKVDNQGTAVIHRTGALTGASDGTQLTFWLGALKIPSLPPAGKNIFNIGDGVTATNHIFLAQIRSDGNLYFYMKDLDVPAVRVNKITNDAPISANTLYNLYFTCDLSAGTSAIYLNGTELTSFATNVTNTGVHSLGSAAESCTTVKHDSLDAIGLDMSEFGEMWLDQVNRPLSAFLSGGTRQWLGADGSAPGSQPLIYFEGTAAEFNADQANKGSGGAFELYDAGEPWADVA